MHRLPDTPDTVAIVCDGEGLRHRPKTLGEQVPPEVAALVRNARADRLVVYLGAGISIPWPARGPRGNDVAKLLKRDVAEMLEVDVDSLDGADLESLAARVAREAPDRLADLKELAATARDFEGMLPTYAHEVVALLVRERLVRAVSANWDCAVENGGSDIGIRIEGVSSERDLGQIAVGSLPIFKVHGCARRPWTLVLTRDEVDQPRKWAQARVQDALYGGTVAFVGLGTVGAYVSSPVEEIAQQWADDGATIRVVDPFGLSKAWRAALGDRAADVELVSSSDEFFDDLLRALVRKAFGDVRHIARDIDASDPKAWSKAAIEHYDRFLEAMSGAPTDAVLRWWRDGADRQPFIFDSAGQAALLCVARLAGSDEGELIVTGSDGKLVVRTGTRYFEIASRRMRPWTEAETAARHRVEKRRREGAYDPGTPVTVAIAEATGDFPAADAPTNIAASNEDASDIAAAGSDAIRIVKAENAFSAELAA